MILKCVIVLMVGILLHITIKKFELINSKFIDVSKLLLLSILSWKVGSFLLHDIINKFLPKISPSNKAILITGCDTGFGNATALALNNFGFHVFATCYNSKCDGARELLLKCRFPKRMHVVQLDVTNDDQIDQCLTFVKKVLKENDSELWGLVNNAGVGGNVYIECGKFDDHFTRTLSINTLGTIKITRIFLPLIRSSKGRITNISSQLGRYSIPMAGAYCASKFAIIAFSDCLRCEMKRFGVHVSGIEPNLYKTNMVTNGRNNAKKLWNDSNDEIKSVYTLDIFLRHHIIHGDYTKKFGISDVSHVVDAIIASMVDMKPKNEYGINPGFRKIFYLIGYFLPSEIRDFLLSNRTTW